MADLLPGLVGALQRAAARLDALGPARRRALAASVAWTVLVLAYAIGFFGASQARGTGFLDGAFFLVTLALPLILIWLAAWLAEELARQREMIAAMAELAAPLAEALEATRAELSRHGPASPAELRAAVEAALRAAAPRTAERPSERNAGRNAERAPDDPAIARIEAAQVRIEAAHARIEAMLAALGTETRSEGRTEAAAPEAPAQARPRGRGASREREAREGAAREAAARQADLPLAAEPEPEPDEPLGWDEMMRAFDFPRDAGDEEGFRALRRALRRRNLAQMLQAAEDMLTYLSQEGVYMDDLAMDSPDPAAWRRFVAGVRGPDADAAGGVRDEGALEAARGLMKQDAVFRDTALFFLRRFDSVLGDILAGASDEGIAQLADTRSGRAFQLMARATGALE